MHYQKSETHRLKQQGTHQDRDSSVHEQQAAHAHHGRETPPPAQAQERPEREKNKQMSKHSGILGAIENFYIHKYKDLFFFTAFIILCAIAITVSHTITTGDFVDKGVTLKGGVTVTINVPAGTTIDITSIEAAFKAAYPTADVSVLELSQQGVQKGVTVEASDVTAPQVEELITAQLPWLTKNDYSTEMTGPSLGASFFSQTLRAMLVALVCMAFVVFLYFGDSLKAKFLTALFSVLAIVFIWFVQNALVYPLVCIMIIALGYLYFTHSIPSSAVMIAAISTIITTLGVVNLIHLKLSTAGVAAFLMLLGYSIDTDILLSVRVLKRKEGTVYDRVIDAMKTGLTMTITALAAAITALILTQSEVIKEIMLILTIGLLCDIIYTWIQNVGILRWYLEKHAHKHNVHDGTYTGDA